MLTKEEIQARSSEALALGTHGVGCPRSRVPQAEYSASRPCTCAICHGCGELLSSGLLTRGMCTSCWCQEEDKYLAEVLDLV